MIDTRLTLVTVGSAVLSLAVGIALGAGPLQGHADSQTRAQVAELDDQQRGLRTQLAALREGDRYRDTFAAKVAPDLLEGRLAARTIVLVALPDADPRLVTGMQETVRSAGGTVSGTVRMKPAWVDPGQQRFLGDLSKRLAGGSSSALRSTRDLADKVLAGALVSKTPKPGSPDASSATTIGAFAEGGLLTAPADLRQAQLAVVLASAARSDHAGSPRPGVGSPAGAGAESAAGSGGGSATGSAAEGGAWLRLVSALDDAGKGVVVAGESPATALSGGSGTSADGSGGTPRRGEDLVTLLRNDPAPAKKISTVDVADLPSGRIAAVLALAEQWAGRTGHYGATGSPDGTLPEPAGS